MGVVVGPHLPRLTNAILGPRTPAKTSQIAGQLKVNGRGLRPCNGPKEAYDDDMTGKMVIIFELISSGPNFAILARCCVATSCHGDRSQYNPSWCAHHIPHGSCACGSCVAYLCERSCFCLPSPTKTNNMQLFKNLVITSSRRCSY